MQLFDLFSFLICSVSFGTIISLLLLFRTRRLGAWKSFYITAFWLSKNETKQNELLVKENAFNFVSITDERKQRKSRKWNGWMLRRRRRKKNCFSICWKFILEWLLFCLSLIHRLFDLSNDLFIYVKVVAASAIAYCIEC